MEKQRKNTRKNGGITLVALVITIVILLILAGISIAQLTGNGLFGNAKDAKQRYKNAEELENQTLAEYERIMNELGGSGSSGNSGGNSEHEDNHTPSGSSTPANNIIDAQKDDMFNKTVNSIVKDEYDNQIVVPAGFKITEDASNVTQGIVIKDKDENEFVWIPVGTIYKNKEKTNSETIELSRYTFDEKGNLTKKNEEGIYSDFYSSWQHKEEENSDYGNACAKELGKFKTSATTNHGYYIGRYEARTETERIEEGANLTKVTEKANNYIYNYINQLQASQQCQTMYDNDKFTSDLMNSYAWDTAIVFIQKFSGNSSYSRKTSVNKALATTGTNGKITEDKVCNIYDMASNMLEMTTEICFYWKYPAAVRGGYCFDESYTCYRNSGDPNGCGQDCGFRPILYCSTEN